MITIRVEDVTAAKYRAILNDLLAGKYAYEAKGEQVDAETFVIKFRPGEYAVVSDELLTAKQEEMLKGEKNGYKEVYDAFPRTVNTEDGDEYTVTLD